MKRLGLVCLMLMAASAVKAESLMLTWCGGDAGNFADAANWSGGEEGHLVPQNFDVLVFPRGGTFTKNEGYLTLNGLQVTSPDPVTLTGGKIDFENSAPLTFTGAGEVTIENALHLGYNVNSTTLISIADGSVVHFRGKLTGMDAVKFDDLGTAHIYGDNDYQGKTYLYRGQIHLHSDTALGKGEDTASCGTDINVTATTTAADQLRVYFHGITTDEHFTMRTHKNFSGKVGSPVVFPAGTVTTFNGTVDHKSAVMYAFEGDAKVIHAGKTNFNNPSYAFKAPAELVFCGADSALWYDYMSGTAITRIQTPIRLNDSAAVPQTTARWLRIYGSDPSKSLECENALYVNGISGYPQWQANGSMDICGFDQTFLMLDCSSSYPNGTLKTPMDKPATVHLLLPTTVGNARSDFYGKIHGPISISCEGAKPIAFWGKSDATGSISLSNGANVTFGSAATWSGNSVTVADGSTLTLNGEVFPDDTVIAITDSEDAETPKSRLVLGANIKVSAVVLNGVAIEPGKTIGSTTSGANIIDDAHFSGSGVLAVGEAMLDVTEVSWVGQGADAAFSTAENWDIAPKLPNFANGLVTATFAEGGAEAVMGTDISFKGIVFKGEDFTVSAVPDAVMTIGTRGFAVEADAEEAKRSYTFDAPVVMVGDSMQVDVAGASTELHLTKPMLAATPEASLVFSKRGLGTLYTDGENMVPGERKQLDGTWYAKACSLGPEDTPVTIRQTTGALGFYLNGGIFDQNFSISRTMSPTYTFGAAAGSTNCLVKPFTFSDSYGIAFAFYGSSVTRFQGGFNKTGSWAGMFNLESRSELYFENAPFVYDETSLSARFCSYSVNRARLEFAATGGYARKGFSFAGGVDVHFTADAAISNDQYNCSLNLLRSGESLHPKMHLHNTKQYFGDVTNTPPAGFERFISDNTGAEIAGEAGAELHIRQTGADVVWHPIFTGAASLVKEGDKRLTLAIASPTRGRLEVREGTLGFAAEVGTANWTNCSEVVVSGGVLEVDRPDRFGNQAEYTLSGGKLDLAEGVRLRAKALTLPDGQGGWVRHEAGVYNATKLSEYISGNGELRLASGTVILFK